MSELKENEEKRSRKEERENQQQQRLATPSSCCPVDNSVDKDNSAGSNRRVAMMRQPFHYSTFPPFHYSTIPLLLFLMQSRRGLGRWGKVSVAMGSEPMALQNVSHAKFAKYAKFDSEHWNFGLTIFPMFANHEIHEKVFVCFVCAFVYLLLRQ